MFAVQTLLGVTFVAVTAAVVFATVEFAEDFLPRYGEFTVATLT